MQFYFTLRVYGTLKRSLPTNAPPNGSVDVRIPYFRLEACVGLDAAEAQQLSQVSHRDQRQFFYELLRTFGVEKIDGLGSRKIKLALPCDPLDVRNPMTQDKIVQFSSELQARLKKGIGQLLASSGS